MNKDCARPTHKPTNPVGCRAFYDGEVARRDRPVSRSPRTTPGGPETHGAHRGGAERVGQHRPRQTHQERTGADQRSRETQHDRAQSVAHRATQSAQERERGWQRCTAPHRRPQRPPERATGTAARRGDAVQPDTARRSTERHNATQAARLPRCHPLIACARIGRSEAERHRARHGWQGKNPVISTDAGHGEKKLREF